MGGGRSIQDRFGFAQSLMIPRTSSVTPACATTADGWCEAWPRIRRKYSAFLSRTTEARGKMKPSKRGREKDGGRGRYRSVVFNPLKRGNTSMHSRAHRCKNIKSRDASDGIKACFV